MRLPISMRVLNWPYLPQWMIRVIILDLLLSQKISFPQCVLGAYDPALRCSAPGRVIHRLQQYWPRLGTEKFRFIYGWTGIVLVGYRPANYAEHWNYVESECSSLARTGTLSSIAIGLYMRYYARRMKNARQEPLENTEVQE